MQDRAFSRCTECLTPYVLEATPAARQKSWRLRARSRFVLLVLRDFVAGFVVAQLVLVVLGAATRGIDHAAASHAADRTLPILSLFAIGSGGCTEAQVAAQDGAFFCHHTLSAYYILALFVGLVVAGLAATLRACCCGNCGLECYCGDEYGNDDCSAPCRGGRCDGCLGCYYQPNGQSGGCDSDCGHVMLVFVVVAAVVFAVIGLFAAIATGVGAAQRVLQRHAHVLRKRALASDFQVVDLSRSGAPPPPPRAGGGSLGDGGSGAATNALERAGGHKAVSADLFMDASTTAMEASAPPLPSTMSVAQAEGASAPPIGLADEHTQYLVQMGLL